MTREEIIAILRSPEGRDETRRVYKLGAAVDFVERTIYSRTVSRADAEQMTDAVAKIAEEFFPGSEDTFAIIYGRRLQRVINEVFGSPS
jgi:tRNA(Ser,Leu) C12 N-acetylase TAN1